MADKDKHIVEVKYQKETKDFVAQKKEDKSLARFLLSSDNKTTSSNIKMPAEATATVIPGIIRKQSESNGKVLTMQ